MLVFLWPWRVYHEPDSLFGVGSIWTYGGNGEERVSEANYALDGGVSMHCYAEWADGEAYAGSVAAGPSRRGRVAGIPNPRVGPCSILRKGKTEPVYREATHYNQIILRD